MDRIVIVGASLAGLRAAEALRERGYAGTIQLIGGETHLPYDRPPLSKQVLTGEWELDRVALAPTDPAAALDLELQLSTWATGLDLDSRTLVTTAGAVPYDGLVLATGAVVRRLPGQPEVEGLHVLRTLDDALALKADLDWGPGRVVVVGAGFIGSEVAASARSLGLDVTLVEAAPVPLERALGADMGLELAGVHRRNGVDVRLGTGVDGFVASDRIEGVALADGTVVEADVVVVGVGVRPATDWLESSGLTLEDGVVCDKTLTAAPGVVAAGDVARWPNERFDTVMRVEHWENAIEAGRAAAFALLDGNAAAPFAPVPWFWSDQYDRKIQLAGWPGADATVEVVERDDEAGRLVALYGREGRLVGVLGVNRPRHVMQFRMRIEDGISFADACAS